MTHLFGSDGKDVPVGAEGPAILPLAATRQRQTIRQRGPYSRAPAIMNGACKAHSNAVQCRFAKNFPTLTGSSCSCAAGRHTKNPRVVLGKGSL